jgi:hypothetical protein
MLLPARMAISRHRAVVPASPTKSGPAHVTTFVGAKAAPAGVRPVPRSLHPHTTVTVAIVEDEEEVELHRLASVEEALVPCLA